MRFRLAKSFTQAKRSLPENNNNNKIYLQLYVDDNSYANTEFYISDIKN